MYVARHRRPRFFVQFGGAWSWLLVAIPVVALFGPALVTDSSFAMRDASHFYYPLFAWCGEEWAAGRIPLWNPFENCGLPILADTTSSVFYPGKLLFLLPVDFALRYKLYIVAHIVLAAAGSYALARAWKCTPAAAAFAAIAYACGGSIAFQYCNVVFLVGAAWLPLAALAADRMLTLGSWRASVLFAAVLALMILGGDPQSALHGLLIAGFYALLMGRVAKSPLPTEEMPPRVGLLRRLFLVAAAAVFAYLLAAVQTLPSSEATKYSERAAFNRPRNIYEAATVALAPDSSSQPFGETRVQSIARGFMAAPEQGSHHDLVYDFSVGPWRLAEYFWPNIGGRMFPTHARWMYLIPAERRTWSATLYLGLLPALLALSVFRLRRGGLRERWMSWLVLIATLGSFGHYGVGWLLQEFGIVQPVEGAKGVAPAFGGLYWLMVTLLPTYVYFRYPAKLLPLVALGLSQLAALGMDRTFADRRPRLSRALLLFGVASGALAFVVWFLGDGLFARVTEKDPWLGPFDGRSAYYALLFAFVQSMIIALACRWILTQAWNEPTSRNNWQFAAVALTAVELSLANAWFVATAPADLWRGQPAIADSIWKQEPADGPAVPPRVFRGNFASWSPPSFRLNGSPSRSAQIAEWERQTLFPKHELASSLAHVESYGSIKLMDYESLIYVAKQHGPPQPDKSLLPQPTALRLLGTEYLVLPEKQAPAFADRLPDAAEHWPESAALWQMKRTLPRAWIVHHVTALPSLPHPARIEAVDLRTKEVLFPGNKARDFLKTAVVETDQPLADWQRESGVQITSVGSGDSDRSQLVHYDPQRVVIEAELASPGLLVLSDSWYPGWKAMVTSAGQTRETPIYRTNRILRGVWLPAGQSTVEFRFQPQSFIRGALISAISWSLLGILGLFGIGATFRRSGLTNQTPRL